MPRSKKPVRHTDIRQLLARCETAKYDAEDSRSSSKKGIIRKCKQNAGFIDPLIAVNILDHIDKVGFSIPEKDTRDPKSQLVKGPCPSSRSGLDTWISNPSSASNEVVVRYVDYFDSAESGKSRIYFLDMDTLPTMVSINTQAPAKGFRIKRVRVFALPKNVGDPALSSTLVLFAVPVTTPKAKGVQPLYLGQDATLLTPTSVSDWVCVGDVVWDNLFGVTGYIPVFTNTNETITETSVNLFEIQVSNPDNIREDTQIVQFRVEVEYAANVPLIQKIGCITELDTFAPWNGGMIVPIKTGLRSVLATPLSVHDSM